MSPLHPPRNIGDRLRTSSPPAIGRASPAERPADNRSDSQLGWVSGRRIGGRQPARDPERGGRRAVSVGEAGGAAWTAGTGGRVLS